MKKIDNDIPENSYATSLANVNSSDHTFQHNVYYVLRGQINYSDSNEAETNRRTCTVCRIRSSPTFSGTPGIFK